MALTVEVVDDLDAVGADELLALDATAGALGSRGRLLQHAGDPRWPARYIVARDGDRLVAMVPIYLGHGAQWSDATNQPLDWGYPGTPVQERSALVGGRLEVRGSLRTSDDPDVLRAVGEACRAEVRGREVFFGYFDPRQQRLAEAMFGPVDWLIEYTDHDYPPEVVNGALADLPAGVRHTITAGQRKIAQLGIEADIVPWSAYAGDGGKLIAEHNARKGMPDHAALVGYRLDQWEECDGVSVYIAHATMGGDEGVISLLAYRDELQIYEIGLPDGEGPARRTLYAFLIFDGPRRLARELGLSTIRAGLGADQAKKIRGARPVLRRCGRVRG
ncbi:MAG: hypothetical protein ACJ786_07280 [Catenulispora sp.]